MLMFENILEPELKRTLRTWCVDDFLWGTRRFRAPNCCMLTIYLDKLYCNVGRLIHFSAVFATFNGFCSRFLLLVFPMPSSTPSWVGDSYSTHYSIYT